MSSLDSLIRQSRRPVFRSRPRISVVIERRRGPPQRYVVVLERAGLGREVIGVFDTRGEALAVAGKQAAAWGAPAPTERGDSAP